MSTCNWLDLHTIGSEPYHLCPKISPINDVNSNFHFLFFFILRQRATGPCQNELRKEEPRRALTEGRRNPSDAIHRHVKGNKNPRDPTMDNPPDPPNRGPLPPHQPKDPTNVTNTTYLMCLFQFHSITRRCFQQRTCLAPQVLSKPLRMAMAENLLILIGLSTHCRAVWAYMRSSSQMRAFTFDSCHCSWLNTLSFLSTQMVQTNFHSWPVDCRIV